jgi:uncharacterized protein YqgV (UPF0045/DUF77 family)
MNNKQEKRKKKSTGAGTTMEGEFWSIFGVVEDLKKQVLGL